MNVLATVVVLAIVWLMVIAIRAIYRSIKNQTRSLTPADVAKYMEPEKFHRDLGATVDIMGVTFTRYHQDNFYCDPSNQYVYAQDTQLNRSFFYLNPGIAIDQETFLAGIQKANNKILLTSRM